MFVLTLYILKKRINKDKGLMTLIKKRILKKLPKLLFLVMIVKYLFIKTIIV